MRTLILKLIAWLLTLLLKWGKTRIEAIMDKAPETATPDALHTLSYEPLAERLIAMDKAGDFARVDAALRKLRERSATPTVSDGLGE
jgi:hypothetical protein